MESNIDHAERLAARPAQRFHETPARISMRGARAAYFGPGLDLAPHRNAVAVVALAAGGAFELAFLAENRSARDYPEFCALTW
ncbi:MAG: hypothetical protein KGS44_15250 [Alphaproteobacteria bacterium]|nr:hypothetical protein [Alphaproteobacteria bacterium]